MTLNTNSFTAIVLYLYGLNTWRWKQINITKLKHIPNPCYLGLKIRIGYSHFFLKSMSLDLSHAQSAYPNFKPIKSNFESHYPSVLC